MSVLERKRELSKLEFYKNGQEAHVKFTKFLLGNKIPKRGLYVYVIPGIDLTRQMMEEITAANTIFVKKPEVCKPHETAENNAKIKEREIHQNEAIIKSEQAIQHIQWIIDTVETVNPSDLDEIGEMLIRESSLIKRWRDSYKVIDSEKS